METYRLRQHALVILALSLLGLLALGTVAEATPLLQATTTVTYTPIPTRTATPIPFTATTYTLSSGDKLMVANQITMGDTLTVIMLLCLVAVLVIRFVYDLAYQWGK